MINKTDANKVQAYIDGRIAVRKFRSAANMAIIKELEGVKDLINEMASELKEAGDELIKSVEEEDKKGNELHPRSPPAPIPAHTPQPMSPMIDIPVAPGAKKEEKQEEETLEN